METGRLIGHVVSTRLSRGFYAPRARIAAGPASFKAPIEPPRGMVAKEIAGNSPDPRDLEGQASRKHTEAALIELDDVLMKELESSLATVNQ